MKEETSTIIIQLKPSHKISREKNNAYSFDYSFYTFAILSKNKNYTIRTHAEKMLTENKYTSVSRKKINCPTYT
jgi:hypothetical protein